MKLFWVRVCIVPSCPVDWAGWLAGMGSDASAPWHKKGRIDSTYATVFPGRQRVSREATLLWGARDIKPFPGPYRPE